MAELHDVYGSNYLDESKQSKCAYVLNIIANNLAHRQFNFRLSDSMDLWNSSNRVSPQNIETIIKKVKTINKQMCLLHLEKNSEKINMLPELIIDSPVEYFWIIDAQLHRAYFIYLTPYEVGAY
jgi:hypothetical protein